MELNGRLQDNGVLVLELREDNLDATNLRVFKDLAQSLIQERRAVVLDMAGVQFVDSAGLGALISLLRQLNARGGDLVLCEMSRAVRALFELMRMHRVFRIAESRQDACQAFTPSTGLGQAA
ncbi:STAS domain-containing protein [Mitsuaria sp. WAJ17]|uniref:STAS domain-containing protein n=1 Tax=Mitsuaria sp. WAJ17 TaxID=2761452 RepID=UPI0016032A6A|nr:STAS domain-containing protein [Mitsuaria sp. WAJ17]MBB2487052.1 STAS domain-containing protein [Mitsuaria sp. WAJ17]